MSAHQSTGPTPHRFEVDLAKFDGVTVLGEPLAVLFSFMLRLQFGPPRKGMMDMSATLPQHETEALERAMGRAEREIPGDRRTQEQRDADRLVAVMERVLEVAQAVPNKRAQGAA